MSSGGAKFVSVEPAPAEVMGGKAECANAPVELRRRLVAESLSIGNPANNGRDLPAQSDPRHECHIELDVDEIRAYEHNPRRVINSKFAEIKESIRSCGIRNPLTVTRRPGEKHFIVEAGGNTRLTAIQQLWAETREVRFGRLTVLFRPWRSESQVLTAHLIENEQRGETTFWDKANGVSSLKRQLEMEQGRTLSLRQLEGELKAVGLAVNTATLSQYLFAIERLGTLGGAVVELSGLDVKTIQPRLNALKRYAQHRTSIEEGRLYETVFDPIFRQQVECYRQTRELSATAICNACDRALADHLGESVGRLRDALDPPLQTSSQSTLESRHPDEEMLTSSYMPGAKTELTASPGAERLDSQKAESTKPVTRGEMAVHNGNSVSDARALLNLEVRRFANISGIDQCLRQDEKAPLGYEIEILVRPVEQRDFRDFACRMLGLIASSVENCSSRAEHTCGGGLGSTSESDYSALASVESAIDARLVAWLVDGHDEAAQVFLHILTLTRKVRVGTSSPPRTVNHTKKDGAT